MPQNLKKAARYINQLFGKNQTFSAAVYRMRLLRQRCFKKAITTLKK